MQNIYAATDRLSFLFLAEITQTTTFEKKVEHNMPLELKHMKNSSLVMSHTKSKGCYQSGDAMIKERNKEAKRDVGGVSNKSQWTQSFRNLDNMNKLRQATFSDASLKDP